MEVSPGVGILIWQIICLLVIGTVGFLVVRLLVVNNFPRKALPASSSWVSLPAYPISIFWHAEDARFIAEVPDLPGCVADGTTQVEALNNAAAVTAQWLETARELGRPIPAPSPRLRYA
ncbi:type II toxin-antitoxin system HicB family antitoxin [Hymenobacter sp. ISL-91]|uniref:type II toxin-antitoxin system HicB family antitoxin n=1 Tax=Hymenobacter sp. ISL-91 TaxID=2819151 RepID=UPI001BE5C0EB|nr:type II toxin-antitoxin system HicB family antitoxin [Hymenobacter sp. ISL-91]MBT2557642.1 type II toxin-antitoxin system HicB family antitoxin [Hymenobacter sp. ISL-91]